MISNSEFLALVDCCDRMNLIQSALLLVLSRVQPSIDAYTLEIETFIVDLLVTENQQVVNELRREIYSIRTSSDVNVIENDRN